MEYVIPFPQNDFQQIKKNLVNYNFTNEGSKDKIYKKYILYVFQQYCKENLQKFEKLDTIKFYKEGISLNSGFATCLFCELLDIDVIIECGVAFGVSSQIFAEYFKDKNIIHYAIDYTDKNYKPLKGKNCVWTDNYIFKDTCERLKNYNINFIEGDCFDEIPKIFTKHNNFKNKRICIFIDGPKEDLQITLLNSLCKKYPNVILICCDDVGQSQKSSIYNKVSRKDIFMDNYHSLFVTDEHWFKNLFCFSNEKEVDCLGFAINSFKKTKQYLSRNSKLTGNNLKHIMKSFK